MKNSKNSQANTLLPVRIKLRHVQEITGKSVKSCRHLLNKIREDLGRLKRNYITVTEFCEYTGIDTAIVLQIIVRSRSNPKLPKQFLAK